MRGMLIQRFLETQVENYRIKIHYKILKISFYNENNILVFYNMQHLIMPN